MGKNNNRTCIICQRDYHYCGTCGEDSGKPSWYAIFHNQNCHDIYDVCVAYRDKEITTDEAYNKLSKLDLSDLENFNEGTKGQIEEILASQDKNTTVEDKSNVGSGNKFVSNTKFKKR